MVTALSCQIKIETRFKSYQFKTKQQWKNTKRGKLHGTTRFQMGTMGLHVLQHYWLCCDASNHYCRMLLTRHYDQRPFDETVCDALITNGDVKKRQKRCKTFVMAETSKKVQILVTCAMRGIQLIQKNCLRWGRTRKMGGHLNVCVCAI